MIFYCSTAVRPVSSKTQKGGARHGFQNMSMVNEIISIGIRDLLQPLWLEWFEMKQHWVGYISKDIISRIYIQLLDIWSGYISFCQNGYRIWIYIQKFATSSYHIHIQKSPRKHPFLTGFSRVFRFFSPFGQTHWTKAGTLLPTFDFNFTFMQWDEV